MFEPLKATPKWFAETGLISAALPEPPFINKFTGGQRADVDEQYEHCLSDAAIGVLKESGVTLVFVRFFSGFGLEFEKPEAERLRDFTARAHAQGLKVAFAITLGALTPETLLIEEPEAHNWLQVNQDGDLCACAGEWISSRARPCVNCESNLRYMERVCNAAIDCGADMIHFDEIGYNPEPDTCRCPVCVAAFREYLRQQYGTLNEQTRQAGHDRFGYNTFTHTRPPPFRRMQAGPLFVSSPHEQEWIKFKAFSISQCLARLTRAVYKRNPECALSADILQHLDLCTDAQNGIDFPRQLPHVDVTWQTRLRTNVASAPLDFDSIECRVAASKITRALGACLHTSLDPRHLELSLGLQLALNPAGLGHLGTLEACAENTPVRTLLKTLDGNAATVFKAYRDFYCLHRQELFSGVFPLVNIAVLIDIPSLSFNAHETSSALNTLFAGLLRHNIPYDVIFSSRLEELNRYKCIVVPDARCLAEKYVRQLEHYAIAGGGVVLTASSRHCDEWRRVRPQPAFSALLGEGLHKERVVDVPVMPDDFAQFIQTLRFAADSEMPWSVGTEAGSVLAEAAQTTSGTLLLHAVTLGDEPVRGLRCSMACAAAPHQILPLSPLRQYESIPFTYDNGRVHFGLDEFQRYVLFRIG